MRTEVDCFSHGPYYAARYEKHDELSRLILEVKNSFQSVEERRVFCARDEIARIASADLDKLVQMDDHFKKNRPILVAVPRSKPDHYWSALQLQFRPALSLAIKKSAIVAKGTKEKWIVDGIGWIQRVVETKTTHKRKITDVENNGSEPYPGIAKDTCRLLGDVRGKSIILVDDIYTADIGIDEDCLQFLLDNGAASVVLYTLGRTTSLENR